MHVVQRPQDDGSVLIVASTPYVGAQWLMDGAGAPYVVQEFTRGAMRGLELLTRDGQRSRVVTVRPD
jgi:hypothetical protein